MLSRYSIGNISLRVRCVDFQFLQWSKRKKNAPHAFQHHNPFFKCCIVRTPAATTRPKLSRCRLALLVVHNRVCIDMYSCSCPLFIPSYLFVSYGFLSDRSRCYSAVAVFKFHSLLRMKIIVLARLVFLVLLLLSERW